MSPQGITHEQIQSFQEDFARDPRNRLARNAVTKSSIQSVALNRDVVARTNHTFSHQLKSNDATAQSRSGRCWLFAGLNLFRVEAMKRLNVEKFELSQSYLLFWDKLEKANYFLETILSTLDEPANGRLLMFLLNRLPSLGALLGGFVLWRESLATPSVLTLIALGLYGLLIVLPTIWLAVRTNNGGTT